MIVLVEVVICLLVGVSVSESSTQLMAAIVSSNLVEKDKLSKGRPSI